jgi:hypothetical protein
MHSHKETEAGPCPAPMTLFAALARASTHATSPYIVRAWGPRTAWASKRGAPMALPITAARLGCMEAKGSDCSSTGPCCVTTSSARHGSLKNVWAREREGCAGMAAGRPGSQSQKHAIRVRRSGAHKYHFHSKLLCLACSGPQTEACVTQTCTDRGMCYPDMPSCLTCFMNLAAQPHPSPQVQHKAHPL